MQRIIQISIWLNTHRQINIANVIYIIHSVCFFFLKKQELSFLKKIYFCLFYLSIL